MLRQDLAAAEIEYKTKDGFLDFHATRHTAITRGSRFMLPIDLKNFARHAKIETTMGYVHSDEKALHQQIDLLPLVGKRAPVIDNRKSENGDQKCDQHSGSDSQHVSSSRINCHSSENETTPCKDKELSSKDSDCHQRARRDSNPQPPDRQSSKSSGKKLGKSGENTNFSPSDDFQILPNFL
jgi:hypothetical protein